MESDPRQILIEGQLEHIVKRVTKNCVRLLRYDISSSVDSMAGFLVDHFKVTLHLREGDLVKEIHLFVKSIPRVNAPKASFIDENNFFRRESLTFSFFDEMPDDEFSSKNPWGVKAVVHNDSILVLPDLSVEGYRTYPAQQYLDMEHVLVAVTSLARFHAAFIRNRPPIFNRINSCPLSKKKLTYFFKDSQFFDCPWLHATIKSTTNLLKEFSPNIDQYPKNLQEHLTTWCMEACAGMKEYDDTLNVIIYKDLWANNVMFKYIGAKPVNAVLIDFQCARFAPPAFDVMIFLYYTTSRKFRAQYETDVLNHYYSEFSNNIDTSARSQLNNMNYDRQAFLGWCEKARSAGMIVSIGIHPFILMSPLAAQESFNDPQCYQKHYFEDRTGPVLAHARENECYKARLLEISEEFVEMHLKQ